jgi:hypothetical protein
MRIYTQIFKPGEGYFDLLFWQVSFPGFYIEKVACNYYIYLCL